MSTGDVRQLLRECCIARSSYDVRNLWRITTSVQQTIGGQPSPMATVGNAVVVLDRPPQFCLHGRTTATVAGTMCCDCGVIVNQVHANVDVSHSRPPVCDLSSAGETLLSEVGIDGTATADAAACLQEWRRHIGVIQDQPSEVVHNAFRIFRLVYEQQGPISGCKARAIILVSLLYSNRLLYGNNKSNEEYLLRKLCIPTRVMNRAFGSLAAVTLINKETSVVTIGRSTQC